MTEPFLGPAALWSDVSQALVWGERNGYTLGYRQGHRDGFVSGQAAAQAQDAEFAALVEQEFHRRTLQGEREADLVRRLIDALRTEQNRQNHPHFYPHRRAA